MRAWTTEELDRIAGKDDLHIAPFREDGKTFGTPTWIWSVPVEGRLFVRAYNGQASRWYKAAMQQKAGKIDAAGMSVEVRFKPADQSLEKVIDAAYERRYSTSLPSA